MKSVKFLETYIEGFGSFITGKTFELDRGGVNILRGSNGAGKTTVFNALYWGLYGDNLKDLTNGKLPTKKKFRPKNWKGTKVVNKLIVDGIPYEICRHIDYSGETHGLIPGSKLMIVENGELLETELHKSHGQEFINDLIGVDSKGFINSILFGQRMKKFIESSADEKRKIFESIFDAEFVEQAKEKAKSHKEDLQKDIVEFQSEQRVIDTKISNIKEKITEGEKILEEFETQRDERMSKTKTFINEFQGKVMDSEGQLSSLQITLKKLKFNPDDNIQDEYNSLNKQKQTESEILSKLSKQLVDTKEQIEESNLRIKEIEQGIKDSSSATCPRCYQALSKTDREKIKKDLEQKLEKEREVIKILSAKIPDLEKQIKPQEKVISKIVKSIESIQDKMDNYKDLSRQYNELKSKISNLETLIKSNKESLDRYKRQLEEQKAETKPNINLEDLNKNLTQLRVNTEDLDDKIEVKSQELEKVEWWIKKGFGAGGLKSFIFNAMLSLLNQSIMKYASRLGFLVKFSIDMEKATKPFLTKCYTSDRVELDYDEFSGGEKARVDIATAFAIHDVVSAAVDINILIMDEVFESLDDEGIEDAFDLIRLKTEGKTSYIITHSQTIDSMNCKVIEFYKQGKDTQYK